MENTGPDPHLDDLFTALGPTDIYGLIFKMPWMDRRKCLLWSISGKCNERKIQGSGMHLFCM
jgi:hypothetical protein